ncbi:PfkB family carbohydrate kinase [Stappia indica]|uniref:PfkB family carbohydrate kinase n=1 Tax=Stappia indica TaxID=538381 RepID=UPI001CD1ACD4|nr:PfkB family carbohydrate kinase [Stappia indica]MCA1299960.1 PfkB family carbohydrate kinase [Stappia indica]
MPVPSSAPRAPAPSIALIGAIHLDTIAHAAVPIRRETSTPARFVSRPGGVATNVARALAKLDIACALAGVVGDDAAGAQLCAELSAQGLDMSAVRRLQGRATGRYLALHDPDGALAAAVVDGEITEALPAKAFTPLPTVLIEAAVWFLDTNLPPATLARLAKDAGPRRRLAADAVSCAKAPRLAAILPRLDLLFCNRAEAAALLAIETLPPADDLAAALVERGVSACCVSDGNAPLTLADNTGIRRLDVPHVAVRDVTGAGDALIAGTLAGLHHGRTLDAAARAGLAAAALTLSAEGAAPDSLNWRAISGED